MRNAFHIDHIHPKSKFTQRNYDKMGLFQDQREFYNDHVNGLANLQLLDSIPNTEKSNISFSEWLEKNYSDELSKKVYMERHYIPDVDYEFRNFIDFYIEREKILFTKLKEILLK